MGEPVHLALDYSLVSLEAREPREGKSVFLWKEKVWFLLALKFFQIKGAQVLGN